MILILVAMLTLHGLTASAAIQSPVIGIYTQEAPKSSSIRTFINSAYVKYLQMAGAQVAPLFYNTTAENLRKTLSKINGVLFTGGSAVINISNLWTQNAQVILDYAMKQNDQGRIFPLWGTCQGHELFSYLTSNNDPNVLQRVNGQDPIINTIDILNKTNDFFNRWDQRHISAASSGKGIFTFNHSYAVYTSYFNNSQLLKNFWTLVGKTTSPSGQEFVSMMQGKKYPFYSVMFHPEMNPFEWVVEVDRTELVTQCVQFLANNFVQKARLSPNRYADQDDFIRSLIYNYKPRQPVPSDNLPDTLVYFFNEQNL